MVACNSSTAPACSVAPSASAWDASAKLLDPADTWLDASPIERMVVVIWSLKPLMEANNLANSPVYFSGILERTA